MNSKSFRIIKQLCSGQSYQIDDLGSKLGISSRVIRYEIEKANSFLYREGFSKIECSRSKVSLSVSEEEREKLKQWLAGLSADYFTLSADERKTIILILLLSSPGYLTSQFLADTLSVSKSCIDKDLSIIKTQVKKEGLQLFSKPGSGIFLSGNEQKIRELCFGVVEHNLHFADYISGEKYNPGYVERQVQKYFCDTWFNSLVAIAHSIEEKANKKLSYNSLRNLTLNLCVILTRISIHKSILADHENQALLQATNEYKVAEEISRQVEKCFQVDLSIYDRCTLTVLLVSSKYSNPEPYLKEDWAQVQILADRIIRAMSKRLQIPFYDEEEIYTALQAHLGPMIFRLKNKMPNDNPNLELIKTNYEDVFNNLTSVIDAIHSPLLDGIREEDIAYLSLHFCASIVRRKRMFTVSNVAIVCVHGIGTATLLKELICSRFKSIRIITITTGSDLNFTDLEGIDFIISSIPLPDCAYPWVQVNPILTDEDYQIIEDMIEKYSTKNNPTDNSLDFFNDIVSTVERQSVTDNLPNFVDSLQECFTRAGISIKHNKVQPSLHQLLPPEKIRCNQNALDWKDAVTLAGSILVESRDVTQDFIQSMIDTVENTGPYVVISKGVALIHGEGGLGVNHLAMSLVTLKNPVYFHHPTNDPVKLILCLAPIDNSSHVSALEDFMNFLRSNDVDTICEEDDPVVLNKSLHRSALLI
jgi:transcriptional antiterminator/mannitol/fructose-specific phosphotransferase system IIA component (Ntr-type)